MFISVVICVYNEEKLLNACLDSLVQQTIGGKRYELIIVDDESTDNSAWIARSWCEREIQGVPKIKYLRIAHGGLSVARNIGIAHASGDIVAFIDGDAIANPTWLAEIYCVFRESAADYVGGRIELLNKGSWVARLSQNTRHHQIFGPSVYHSSVIGCNMAFRRALFGKYGGFNENFVSRGDETSFVERIQRHTIYMPAPNAVVKHERPETLRDWIRVEWKSAVLYGMTKKIAKPPIIKSFTFWSFQFTRGHAAPALVLACLGIKPAVILAGMAAVLFVKDATLPPQSYILRHVMKIYGTAFGILLYLAFRGSFAAISWYGMIIGSFRHSKSAVIEGGATPERLIEERTNTRILRSNVSI